MMKRGALGIAIAVTTTACGLDLGAGGGAVNTGGGVGFGRLAASTKLPFPIAPPINRDGILLGVAMEGRMEAKEGARFLGGISFGYGTNPVRTAFRRVGWEAYGEFGTPFRSTLFHRGDLYAGGAFGLPIPLEATRGLSDLNDTTKILTREFELVPLVRARYYLDHPDDASSVERFEVTMGLVLRLRVFTDLI